MGRSVLQGILARGLPQVLGVYVGVGWGLLQFTDWAVGHFELDPGLADVFLMVWLLGAPVVVLLRWRRGEVLRDPPSAVPPTSGAAPSRSVAVLPFTNLSASADDAYLSSGITEELTSALARVPVLRVASRTSALACSARGGDVRSIGRQLNVQAVLEGSVQRSGDRLRVSTQLVDVAAGYQLWAERFDSGMQDVFAIEDRIAERVTHALQVILGEADRQALLRGAPSDVRAYELYLRGRQYFHQSRRRSLRFARELYTHATELDPRYALAHAGIAASNALLRMYYPTGEADMAQAELASLRALELDPALAEAHAARGAVLFLTDRLEAAEQEFQTAITLDPRLFDAHYFYARCCYQCGRMEEAARRFEDAFAVQENYQAAFFAAQAWEALGSPEAAAGYRRALEVVERHMELNPDDPRAATMRAVSLCRLGRSPEGVHWGEQAIEIDPEDASVRYNVACLFAVAGEHERALDCLQEALRVGFGNVEWLRRDPDLDSLRGDARFEQLIESAAVVPSA